ncbi:hypothetical protein F3N42_01245 [Marinihelvus fidelis]|uniref:DUF3108 domain-containing protein n=1 Tax=Marinihelvus fidelis TaxID=2613842 RepID=A0A5N0TI80_9GAMM|nr:DUF6134 family protein [Marinihelvus fidelis]KAA9134198.1 hypothetical protein F3N42_01245 [Marinihelvus fidelis]
MMRQAGCHAVMLALVASTTATASDPVLTESLHFQVYLDDREIGHHRFDVHAEGDTTRVHIEARFEVSWWVLTAYRYRHDNVETWQDDCLMALQSSTDDDGDEHRVDVRHAEGAVAISRAQGSDYTLQGCARTFAYWDVDALRSGPMINAQTGETVDVTVSQAMPDRLALNGDEVVAERRELNWSDGEITVWHTPDDGRWIGLQAPAPGGRTIRYVPVSSG